MLTWEGKKKKKRRVFYPDCRSHAVRADLSKVSAHDAVVKSIKQHNHTNIHRVLCFDPVQREKGITLLCSCTHVSTANLTVLNGTERCLNGVM